MGTRFSNIWLAKQKLLSPFITKMTEFYSDVTRTVPRSALSALGLLRNSAEATAVGIKSFFVRLCNRVRGDNTSAKGDEMRKTPLMLTISSCLGGNGRNSHDRREAL